MPEKETIQPIQPKNCLNLIKGLFIKPPFEELSFNEKAWLKILCYINLVGSLEVTGLGKIENNIITDVKLLNQIVASAHVQCTETAISDFIAELPKNEIKYWQLDWHSHVNMSVNPSSTDYINYELMNEIRGKSGFPFMVINKKQDINCKWYFCDDVSKDIKVVKPDNIALSEAALVAIYQGCEQDIIKYCKQKIHYNAKKNIIQNPEKPEQILMDCNYQDY